MRTALIVIGLLLAIAGGLLLGGAFSLAGKDEVLRVGDTSVAISREGVKISDQGQRDRQLGIGLLVIGGIGVLSGALMRRR
jgi:hypothetical protein